MSHSGVVIMKLGLTYSSSWNATILFICEKSIEIPDNGAKKLPSTLEPAPKGTMEELNDPGRRCQWEQEEYLLGRGSDHRS